MARTQNLYSIYKLPSSFICANDLNIKSYTKRQAQLDANIVSIGDNILLDRIRAYRGDNRSYKEIFEDVQKYRRMLRVCKKEGKNKEARVLAQFITDSIFVRDIISVYIEKKSDYKRLAKKGFYVNGIKYVRWSASASQIRHQMVFFINEELYKPLYKTLMCGLDEKIKEYNLAKFSAYFSLASSSIMWVDTPRVCVIKDFETTLKNQKVDWIYHDERDVACVREQVMDITMNSADGQGLISPECALRWSKNLELDYVPSSFVVRSCFIKGNLVPFDFKEYAHRNGIERIYDRWGVGYNIDDIDVLLSESQFKMYKLYGSWQEYEEKVKEGGIKWGVARYNRKEDEEYVLSTYQSEQVLKINKDEVRELIKPTIDWLQKICSGEALYAMLYSFGGFREGEATYQNVYSRAQSVAMKAVVKNVDFLKDSFIQRKIYRNIVESINKAKIGKIWIRGNFSFMISDPIAQCRSALGLEPVGEIPGDHIYSNFWHGRVAEGKEIALCRYPLLDKHEINHCTLYRSDEADYWYQYIKSGIIYSIYDTSTLRHSDSDWDGDLVMGTDNQYYLKGSLKDVTNVITYEKQSVPSQKMTYANFIKTDLRGLGTRVGVYSNYSTVLETMLALFTKEDQEYQRNEILTRKKLLREINGQEIDKIKGVDAKGPDKERWLKFKKIDPEDDDITKAEKYRHNSLVISKKPYFFRYLYPELNKKYKQYERSYDTVSRCMFGMKFKKLLVKENKTELEMRLIRRYHKFSPLINSDCTMNILCREFEDIDFNIQYDKEACNMLPTFEGEFEPNEEITLKLRTLYRKYSNRKAVAYLNTLYDPSKQEDDYNEMRFGVLDAIRDDIREELEELNLSPKETLFHIGQLSKKYAKFNWAFAWDIMGDSILSCIEQGETWVPVEDENGEEYLGKRYSLKRVYKEPRAKIIFCDEWVKEGENNEEDVEQNDND